jgi:hypothetical protein
LLAHLKELRQICNKRRGMRMGDHVQSRIHPELRIEKTGASNRIVGIFLVVLGVVVMGAPVGLGVSFSGYGWFLMAAVSFGLIYLGLRYAGLDLREWLLALLQRRAWQRQQARADGEIVDRAVKEHKDGYGDVLYYRYWITFRSESTKGPVVLKARVDKQQYNKLAGAKSVMVRYAPGNPRLALLEGEWED